MKSKANFQLTSFRTPYYLRNPHSQSIYAGIFLKGESVKYRRERLVTPDEDFFDVDIVDGRGPVVIACHGFEGSSNSTHITRLMTLIQKLDGAVMQLIIVLAQEKLIIHFTHTMQEKLKI